jgi:UTP--glucose-1-phosphate uridylyltransferase
MEAGDVQWISSGSAVVPTLKGEQMVAAVMASSDFKPFARKMRRADLPQVFIDTFHFYYDQLVHGATGYITRADAGPVAAIPHYEDLGAAELAAGEQALDRAIVLKLNGGLGTSMGMSGPKSLLPVKNGLSFLDIIVHQVLYLRTTTGARLPLVLMNSFNTREETLAALAQFADFHQHIPLDFVQHKQPKIWKESLAPAEWRDDREKEWCPPGHGDIYTALVTSNMLELLLSEGYEYAFVSNSDNLGAELDLRILGYFAANHVPFLMEVADRTPADRKGGHLAQRPDGQLILRESAQCPPDEEAEFQDIQRYRYFNTNNLWINLRSLAQQLDEHQGVMPLPLIRNEKPVDPSDPKTPRVYQLETAMGAAIAVFAGAQALRVPRSRFAPVKKNSDLLVIMSDAYALGEDFRLRLVDEQREQPPVVALDDRYYQLYNDMRQRFPHGAPSLRACDELRVKGDVRFGKDVRVVGKVAITNESDQQVAVEDGAVLNG